MHGLVAIDFHHIFKFSVDDDRHVSPLSASEIQDQSQFTVQLGVQHWTVQTPIGSILKYEQGAVLSMSPINSSHHVTSTLAQGSHGLVKLSVTSHVLTVIVVHHFQGFIGVGFSPHHLFDTLQIVFLEGERVRGSLSEESGRAHYTHHQSVGKSALEWVVDLVVQGVVGDIVGPNIASDHGVAHQVLSTAYVSHQIYVDLLIEYDLAEVRFQFDILGLQSERLGTSKGSTPQFNWVEVKLDTKLHVGDQQLA